MLTITNLVLISAVAALLLVVAAVYLAFRREDALREELAESLATGLNQVASLHPVIDLERCIGSAACVEACPESVLGRVDGITQIIQGSSCIGHGRCHASCPVGAIALVFGTAERGVDIPHLRAGYETNVDGVFAVGELGGMGLIRNTMRQGLKVVESIPAALSRPDIPTCDDVKLVDVVIVGAGPAGIAAALGCVDQGISYVLLEQFTMGGSVTHYPRRKLVFTEDVPLPIVGSFGGKEEMLKEDVVAEFRRILVAADIKILENRRVTSITGQLGYFKAAATRDDGTKESYRGKTVVLAIGRRGTPRQLGVPGEEQSHVVYRLIDPEQYRQRRILCVGGGDSSVEAAVSLSRLARTQVHLSYRGKSFFRTKKENRKALEAAVMKGGLRLHLESEVAEITTNTVILKEKNTGRRKVLEIDDVIVNIGGQLPTPFLESMGVVVETKHGEIAVPGSGQSGRHSTSLSARHRSVSKRLKKEQEKA